MPSASANKSLKVALIITTCILYPLKEDTIVPLNTKSCL